MCPQHGRTYGRPAACSLQPSDGRTAFDKNGFLLELGGVGQHFLGESQSSFYAHMRAKFGRGPTAVSKKVPFNFISRLEMHPLAARVVLDCSKRPIIYAFCFESVASPNMNERYCSA